MSQTITRFVREMMHISDNVFFISFAILISVLVLIIVYWFYTRKRMHELQHQIPANVLKSYLDSVIQNSNALKSSLFRGGGLDITDGIPSVVPTGDLARGGVADGADLAAKNAEISALHGQIATKDYQIRDLEAQLASRPAGSGEAGEETKILQDELAKLRADLSSKQAELEAAQAAGGGDAGGADPAELNALKGENGELKDRLKEYEIIEEDLANLRKLQQENEQLKQTIDQMGGAAPAPAPEAAAEPAPAPEPTPEPAPAPEPEPEPAPEPAAEIPETVAEGEEDLEAAMAAAITEPAAEEAAPAEASADEEMVPANEGEQKSAEELLSEFEKMLG